MGFIPFSFGLIFYWLGELGGEYFSLFLASWFMVLGILWIHLGWKKLKIIIFPVIFALTMFPPPQFIFKNLTLKLKLISSQIGVMMMQAYGLSAYREGNIIDLGFTQLQVVDACSGLRYLFPLIVLAILLAYFFKAQLWKKIILVIAAVPLTIITNSLRIALTGILSEIWGPKVAEGFFHDFEGWIIFMFSLGILLFLMFVLGKIPPAYQRKKDKDDAENAPSPAEPKNAAKKPIVRSLFDPPHFTVAVLLLGITLALSHGVEFREKIPMTTSFSSFPENIGRWEGKRLSMEQKFIDELDLSDYVISDYMDRSGKTVNFYVAYYESQSKGESIHSPATCLPGSGWVFKKAGTTRIPVSETGDETMPVNRAFMQKGNAKQLTYYWFPARGRTLTNAYQLKWFTFWDALTRQRTDGALVRLITSVYPGETESDADNRLQGFVREINPVLSAFLPE